jgi:hypothetical protein
MELRSRHRLVCLCPELFYRWYHRIKRHNPSVMMISRQLGLVLWAPPELAPRKNWLVKNENNCFVLKPACKLREGRPTRLSDLLSFDGEMHSNIHRDLPLPR